MRLPLLPSSVRMVLLTGWALPLLVLFAACVQETQPDRRTVTVDRGAYDPAISPDGSTIAMGILGTLWMLPVDGGIATQFTHGQGWDHDPVWSQDGRHLAYVHGTPTSSAIVLHTFATGTSRTLYGRAPSEAVRSSRWGPVFSLGNLAFHPENDRLYFIDFRSGIWSVDMSGRSRPEPEQLLPGSGRIGRPGVTETSSFAFSPDGQSIVVEMDTTDMWSHLHISQIHSTSFAQLTQTDTAKHTAVNWVQDGRSIVYLERYAGDESLIIHSLDDARTRRVELGPFNGREVTLHPDGQRALVVSGRQLETVMLADGAVSPVPFEATIPLPPRSDGDLTITNARLFDATGAGVLERATVEIRSGRIYSVSDEPYGGSSSEQVIDAGGRFLMPGLVASHSHLWGGDSFQQAAALTRGVTSRFDPGSYLPATLNLRDAIAHGILEGPHIYTSGPVIDGADGRARPFIVANVTDAHDARDLVGELHRQGVDAIKLYAFLQPDVLEAAIAEAHELGLPVIGDMVSTPWSVALESGIDGFVHIMDHKWRFISGDRPDPEAGPWAVIEPDSATMNDFFSSVAAAGAMFDPTVMASSQYFEAGHFAAALEGEGDSASVHRAHILADIVRAMHRQGVKWVAGTDTGPYDLLDEMEIYELIGIPNAVILHTATANAARWLRKSDFGTVEVGKRGDLILVDGDPLERIRDLEKVVMVVQSGRVVLER